MPEEYEPVQDSSEDSIQNDGSQDGPIDDLLTDEPIQDVAPAPAPIHVQAPVQTPPSFIAQPLVAPPITLPEMPQTNISAYTMDRLTPERVARLENVFDAAQMEEVLAIANDAARHAAEQVTQQLGTHAQNVAHAVAQTVVRERAMEQRHASEIGIPRQYLADVEAYSPMVGLNVTDPKARAEAAVLLAMHTRAQQAGNNLNDEFDRYKAARDAERPTAPTPARQTVAAVRPLAPEAQPTRSSIRSGAPVGAAAAARNGESLLERHFPMAKKLRED